MNWDDFKKKRITISVASLVALLLVSWQVLPVSYQAFVTYHVDLIMKTTERDHLLLAATSQTLEVQIIRSDIKDLRQEYYRLKEWLAKDPEAPAWVQERLEDVKTEMDRLQEQRDCINTGRCPKTKEADDG